MAEFDAVIFDNDNTISKIYPNPRIYWSDVFVKTVEECGGKVPGGKEEEYMLAYYTRKGFTEKLKTIGLKTTWDEFQKAKGVVDERERIRYIREGKAGLFSDAVDFLGFLRGKEIKYGVATFTTKAVVMEAFKRHPDLRPPQAFFDWNDSLAGDKLEKPDPRIAKLVLGQLGAAAERSMMVGDRLTDIEMGNLAGMTTVLVKRAEEDGDFVGQMEKEIEIAQSDPESHNKIPNHQVLRLTEIKDIVG